MITFNFESVFRLACISLVYTHNIIQLNDQRFAKFVLRHIDKVPTTQHFYEFQSDSLEICFDRCVATTPCISINYNIGSKQCQLVNYDINTGKDYEARSGWQHFDTGRTSIIRILSSDKNYCMTIGECSYLSKFLLTVIGYLRPARVLKASMAIIFTLKFFKKFYRIEFAQLLFIIIPVRV